MKPSKEFDRFDVGMKTVLSISREELKRREEEWKKNRPQRKKGKAKTASPAPASSSNHT